MADFLKLEKWCNGCYCNVISSSGAILSSVVMGINAPSRSFQPKLEGRLLRFLSHLLNPIGSRDSKLVLHAESKLLEMVGAFIRFRRVFLTKMISCFSQIFRDSYFAKKETLLSLNLPLMSHPVSPWKGGKADTASLPRNMCTDVILVNPVRVFLKSSEQLIFP